MQREDSREEFQKKRFDEAEEIANRKHGRLEAILFHQSIFLGGFTEGMS